MRMIIGLVIALGLASPLSAQDTTDNAVQSTTPAKESLYRDPHRAMLLGALIPGAGHIYAGEYWHGFGTYELTVGSIGMGAMIFILDGCTLDFTAAKPCKASAALVDHVVGIATMGFGLWTWIAGARDAQHAAERANVRHAARSQRASLMVNPMGGPSNATEIGLSVHW